MMTAVDKEPRRGAANRPGALLVSHLLSARFARGCLARPLKAPAARRGLKYDNPLGDGLP